MGNGWGNDDSRGKSGWNRDLGLARTDDTFDIGRLLRTGPPVQSIFRVVRLTSLLFARPQSSYVRDEILPHLKYFDLESDTKFDFYCVGYHFATGTEQVVAEIAKKTWAFSDEEFIHRKNQLEERTKWRYSGGADLLICNEEWVVTDGRTENRLDLATALSINLDKVVKKGAILNFETFFQSVLRFAGKTSSQLSNGQIPELTADAVRNGILSFVPDALRDPLRKAEHFAVHDIRP